MKAFVDTDVLIWHLRGARKAVRFFEKLIDSGEYELWTGAMQRAEVVFFMRPGEEEATELFLSQFSTAPVTQRIVDTAGRLFREWNPKQGIDVNDALLAATAMETGGHVFTLNKKHYPMPGLIVKKAW